MFLQNLNNYEKIIQTRHFQTYLYCLLENPPNSIMSKDRENHSFLGLLMVFLLMTLSHIKYTWSLAIWLGTGPKTTLPQEIEWPRGSQIIGSSVKIQAKKDD